MLEPSGAGLPGASARTCAASSSIARLSPASIERALRVAELIVYGYIVFSRFHSMRAEGWRASGATSARSTPSAWLANDTPGALTTRRGASRTVSRSSGFRRAGGSVITWAMRPVASSASSAAAPSAPTAKAYTIRPFAL